MFRLASYHLFCILHCLCVYSFTISFREAQKFSSTLPELEKEILMANIGMTIIYNGKIIFLFYRESTKADTEQKIFIKGLCEKSCCICGNLWSRRDTHSRHLCVFFSIAATAVCIFMSAIPFTYCSHTCQERINNPRKFISLNRQRASEIFL